MEATTDGAILPDGRYLACGRGVVVLYAGESVELFSEGVGRGGTRTVARVVELGGEDCVAWSTRPA